MKFLNILPLIICLSLYGETTPIEDENNTTQETKETNIDIPSKFTQDTVTEKDPLFHLSLETSYTSLSRDIKNSNSVIKSKVNDLFQAKVDLLLFPKKYDISFSYTKNITNNIESNLYNPNNYDDNTEQTHISAIPYYNSNYGGIGVFYNSTEQNSYYTNNTGSALGPYKYKNKDEFLFAFPITSGTNVDNYIQNGQSYQTKEKASYLGLKYLFPESKYLVEGFNIYYSQMDRQSVYYAKINTSTLPQHKIIHIDEKGVLYGLGIQKTTENLPTNTLSLDLLQISKGQFDGFPDIKLSEYSLGATYKANNWYFKTIALLYVAEEYYSDEGVLELFIPEHRDLWLSFHLGYSF